MKRLLKVRQSYPRIISETTDWFLGNLPGPSLIRINPSHTICNLSCAMCGLPNLRLSGNRIEFQKMINDRPNTSQYVALIDSLKFPTRHITVVGGGEPLLYPGITEIFKAVKCKGLSNSLITNGVLLKGTITDQLVSDGW